MLCQSMAMDCIYYNHWENPVPICDEIAVVEVNKYFLCQDCADSLEIFQESKDLWKRIDKNR